MTTTWTVSGRRMGVPTSELVNRVNKELSKFSYIPGTKIECDQWGDGTEPLLAIRVGRPAKQVQYPEGADFPVTQTLPMALGELFHRNGHVNVGCLKNTLVQMLRAIELHEMDEWLRYQGRPLHAAHFGKMTYTWFTGTTPAAQK